MSRSISEPFADDAADSALGPLNIVDAQSDTVAVPEVELGEITMKVAFGAVLVDARHPALED